MTSKKKIIFVLPALCSGGAERAIITLMNNINRDIFDPEMVVLDESGPLRDWVSDTIPVHGLGGISVGRGYFKLKSKLLELKPDIVMTTMAHSNFLLMLLKPFFPQTKFIIREAVIPSSILHKHRKKAFLLKGLYKALYPRSDVVISPSQDIIDEFERFIGLKIDNHRLLHNQVDTRSISKTIDNAPEHKRASDCVRFVCAGRLHYQKGYDRLIEALKEFSPQQSWELFILGEGREEKSLKALTVKNGLEDNIKFLGNLSKPWAMIASADYLLLPSRWEGMPNIVLESLACGTPIIAFSDANGVKEIQMHCTEGDILIAQNMEAFTQCMSQAMPQETSVPKQSKLPDVFQTENVMKQFETILLELC